MRTRLFSLLILLIFTTNLIAQAPLFYWANKIAGPNFDRGDAIVADKQGNTYTFGIFSGTIDFDPGPGIVDLTSIYNNSIFVTKHDPVGNLQWAIRLGGEYAMDMAIDQLGNIYTLGLFQDSADFDPGTGTHYLYSNGLKDFFITKIDPSGNLIWAKNIGGLDNEWGYTLAVDQEGSVYTTANLLATVDFDLGPGTYELTKVGCLGNIFITKNTTDGDFIWAKQIIGDSYNEPRNIAVDTNGNVLITGYFCGTLDCDPHPLGYQAITSNGGEDIFIIKYDINGNYLWAKNIGGIENDRGLSITTDNYGNVCTTGYFADSVDFDPDTTTHIQLAGSDKDIFSLKLDSLGSFQWLAPIGPSNGGEGLAITTDYLGNVYTTGHFSGSASLGSSSTAISISSNGYSDIFISKYDWYGNPEWAYSMGGGVSDKGRSIFVDDDMYIYTTGQYRGMVDFDPGIGTQYLSAVSGYEAFILKLGTCMPSNVSLFETECSCFIFNGISLTTSGIYYDSLINSFGCDSIITLDLTIVEVDTYVIQNGNELTASTGGALYQWMDCNNGFSPITGATSQTFFPTQNGSYACIITQDGCTDTSSCFTVNTIGLEAISDNLEIRFFPNPVNENLFVELPLSHSVLPSRIEILNTNGQVVLQKEIGNERIVEVNMKSLLAGEYFVRVMAGNQQVYTEKLINE